MLNDHIPPEQRRQQAEGAREKAEDSRQDAEQGRGFTEKHRISAESARNDAEKFRRLATPVSGERVANALLSGSLGVLAGSPKALLAEIEHACIS